MKLQPIPDYVNSFDDYRWKQQGKEMVVYSSESTRFRITVETGHPEKYFAAAIARHEKLQEQGIDVDCEDAQEFATNLLNTMFEHLSPYKIKHVANALEKYLAEWEAERGSPISAWCDCTDQ